MSCVVDGTNINDLPVGLKPGKERRGRIEQNRFEVVASHMLHMLEEKSCDFAFSVILFDDRLVMFKGGGLIQNTPNTRKELITFFKSYGPAGGTDLALATRAIVDVPGAQECFLLTDGEAPHQEEEIVLAAKKSKIPVHFIGVDLSGEGKRLLLRQENST